MIGGTSGRNFNWSGQVEDEVRLLAVRCDGHGGLSGILVSVGDVLISDSSWKCSRNNKLMAGKEWYETDFDDSSWSDAHVLGEHESRHRNEVFSMVHYASWIWHDSSNRTSNGAVFCRGRTGINNTKFLKTQAFNQRQSIQFTSFPPCVDLFSSYRSDTARSL